MLDPAVLGWVGTKCLHDFDVDSAGNYRFDDVGEVVAPARSGRHSVDATTARLSSISPKPR
jgi:hypothetical protein